VDGAAEIQSEHGAASSCPCPSFSLSESTAAPPLCHTGSDTSQRAYLENGEAERWNSSADHTVQAPTGQTSEWYRSDRCRPGQ
jgi:hypothetical protein